MQMMCFASPTSTLHFVVSLLLMMVVDTVWGQTHPYAGIWFLKSNADNTYFMVPAANPQQTSNEDAFFSFNYAQQNGDPEMPFLTTYKTGKDENSIWVFKPVENENGFYYIVHALTGKYLKYQTYLSGDNARRKFVHLETLSDLDDNTKFQVTTQGSGVKIKPKNSNLYLNIASGNQDSYNGGTSSPYFSGIIGGFSTAGDSNSIWILEDNKNNYTIWPVISTDDGVNFTIASFFESVHDNYKIYYRLGGEAPALTDGGEPVDANTKEYTGSAVPFGASTIVKAIIRANGINSKVVTYNNLKCIQPVITNNFTENNTFTINSVTEGATIYYTTDNTTPSSTLSSSIANGEYFDLADNMTVIKAIAVKDGYSDSDVASYVIPKCATPTINLTNSRQITITTSGKDTDGNIISGTNYYRYKYGSNPTRADGYNGTTDLPINQTVINAIAYADGYLISDVKTRTLTKYAAPVISYANNKVTIIAAETSATIFYTTDGSNVQITSNPTSGGTVELNGINPGTVIKAVAWNKNYAYSNTSQYTATLNIESCAKPTFSFSANTLTITSATAGATIRYTTDGSIPTESSGIYSGSLSVSQGDVIKAIATKDGMAASEVATYTVFKEISSWDDINDAEGSYVLSSSFSVSGTYSGTFKGIIDGQYIVITGNSFPLFDKLDGATVKNVILDNVNIQSSTNTNGHSGAIANEANNSRIYNCGVLAKSGASSISGSGSVGGIVGEISGSTRVVNCFSYANISGGDYRAGIVGRNTGTVGDARIANCMMYGDISSGGTHISPVYGGNHVSNVKNFTEYNYYLYSEEIPDPADNSKKTVKKNKVPYTTVGGASDYNDQLAIEKEDYLMRFPFYRHILNTHRELAAYFLFGSSTGNVSDISSDQIDEIGHWVLEKGTDAAKYLVLERWEKNTQKIAGVNITSLPTTTSMTKDYSGKLITDMGNNGKLSVTVKIGSISETIDLPITDMDTLRYDYTYGKVVLPFANEFSGWTRDYSKICTGWKITQVGSYTSSSVNNYNFADRDNPQKDIYDSNNPYIFAQGGNYIVPYNVSSITIEANFANAFYLSDKTYDIGYDAGYGSPTGLGGNVPISYHGRQVYTDLSTLMTDMKATTNPHEQAIVLVGNFHYSKNGSLANFTNKAITIMSVDDDNNQEPDYGWYSYMNESRPAVPPLRFDFVPIIPIGMSSHVTGSTTYPGVSIWKARGWFELTETCVSIMHQCEIDSNNFGNENGKGNNRWIVNSGYFTQIVRSFNSACKKLSYIQIGGNAYVKELYPGNHSTKTFTNKAVPIIVTGGEIEECCMTGYHVGGKLEGDNLYFWCAGGKIYKFLGAYMETPVQESGHTGGVNMIAQIDHARIQRFFGGGTTQAATITGNIDITINNSLVDFYCGGPEFGNMENGKTVTTNATGTTFGQYYGAGFGGTSLTNVFINENSGLAINGLSTNNGNTVFPQAFTFYTDRRLQTDNNYGIGTAYKFEYIINSTGDKVVPRWYVGRSRFSLATTGSVTNNLSECIVENDFYGAGCQGKVTGTVTSTLTDCEVKGSAFGGGYKAENNAVDVYPTTQPTYSSYNCERGLFSGFGTVAPEKDWKWEQGSNENETYNNKIIYTQNSIVLADLGNVTGDISLTIKGESKIGTGINGGSVYGGGNESKSLSNAIVTLAGNTTVSGNVFGGGNEGPVSGSATVNIEQ